MKNLQCQDLDRSTPASRTPDGKYRPLEPDSRGRGPARALYIQQYVDFSTATQAIIVIHGRQRNAGNYLWVCRQHSRR